MTEGVDTGWREISIEELLDRLTPGTRLTLICKSTSGEEYRRHRTVQRVDKNMVRLRTVPREKNDPIVEIVFIPGDRVILAADGFLLLFRGGNRSRYLWGHV